MEKNLSSIYFDSCCGVFLKGTVAGDKMKTVALFCAMIAIMAMVSAEEAANTLVIIVYFQFLPNCKYHRPLKVYGKY